MILAAQAMHGRPTLDSWSSFRRRSGATGTGNGPRGEGHGQAVVIERRASYFSAQGMLSLLCGAPRSRPAPAITGASQRLRRTELAKPLSLAASGGAGLAALQHNAHTR